MLFDFSGELHKNEVTEQFSVLITVMIRTQKTVNNYYIIKNHNDVVNVMIVNAQYKVDNIQNSRQFQKITSCKSIKFICCYIVQGI